MQRSKTQNRIGLLTETLPIPANLSRKFNFLEEVELPRVAVSAYPLRKRLFDIAGSFILFIFSLPLWPIIALMILVEDGFPIFVRIPRVSGGKIIHVVKFRSMTKGAHALKPALRHMNERADGPFFKMAHDPRLLQMGKLIRRFRVDEIPQFLNVLSGSLSLVGPRPHEPEEVAEYPKEYRAVPQARAGVTGLSQISGASSLPFLKELQIDRDYLKDWSLASDFRILFLTFFIFFFDPTGV